ncbi:MAG TPA: NAD(P)-dependent oxidoreductase [Isosphaeraceae bacterium]|nr:NAD(P)-dependent oxidoreductase [Isosphaeraceae bacterium]
MFRIWFERPLPPEFATLLDGVAVGIGAAHATRETAFESLGQAQAVVASSRVQYDAAFMDRAPDLRVISRTGIGLDNICVPDATRRGIAICNAPDAPTVSTAEHAIALMFAAAKQLKSCERAVRIEARGDFFNEFRGIELKGLCLGLIGLGRIGRRVARVASALEMSVVAYDPLLLSAHAQEGPPPGVVLAPALEEVLRTADIVSLHAPLTSETRRLINAERLALMKTGSILINTARGELVDEAALLEALERGHLRGAGLDVFDPEPPRPDHPLLQREDVIATPHIAGATIASRQRLWRTAIAQALQALRGERPPHLVNPEVWPIDRR